MQLQLPLHYTTRRYTTLITLHYTTTTPTLHYTTLDYTTLYHIRVHNTYSTVHYTTLLTPKHSYNCNCNYTTLITLHYKLRLHYATTTITTALHHTTSSSCGEVTTATFAIIPKTTNLSYRFPIFFRLPPPPCAVLLV